MRNEPKDIKNLEEKIPHGNILFHLAVHLTEMRSASDIMLYTHWHEELEILYIRNGSMILHIDSQSFTVHQGDIILIPPNLLHGASRCNNSPCNFYAIVFHPSIIYSSLNDIVQQNYIEPYFTKTDRKYYYFEGKAKEGNQVLSNVTSIIKTYNNKSHGYELLIKSYILQLLYYIIEYHPDSKEDYRKTDILATIRMKKILTFIEDNYNQPFSLEEWASYVGLSKEQFCRIFKKYFHKSPISYLTHYKINKAADLLIQTNLRIIDIAFETGFESPNYFTIAFKNIVKITPREFRKINRKY